MAQNLEYGGGHLKPEAGNKNKMHKSVILLDKHTLVIKGVSYSKLKT